MLTEFRDGALTVVQATQDRARINYLLREIDSNLFCELQRTHSGEDVWCVVETVGGDRPPVTVLEFRDAYGQPIPNLTEQIVERMRERARRLHDLNQRSIAEGAGQRADRANALLRERREQDSRNAYTEVTAEYLRIAKRSNTQHRGPALALSRRRQERKHVELARAATGRAA